MIDYLKEKKENGTKIIIFGTSKTATKVYDALLKNKILIDGFCDNDNSKWNSLLNNIRIISPDELKSSFPLDTVIIIGSVFYIEIRKQLKGYGFHDLHIYKDIYVKKMSTYEKLVFPKYDNVEVSILVTAYNEWNYTYNCLKSILDRKTNIKYEIIFGDDTSGDETQNIKDYVENITVIRNKVNVHYLRNTNGIAKYASGKYILLFANDTFMLTDYWLDILVKDLEEDQSIGLIGGISYNWDGTDCFYGGYIEKNGDITEYKEAFTAIQDVEYNAAACSMFRKEIWEKIGGYDEIYVPAWFEDMDAQFAVRKLGFRTVVDPKVEYIHYGNVSYGTLKDPKINEVVERNRKTFLERWGSEIERLRSIK